MNSYLKRIVQDLSSVEMQQYWPGFLLPAFAVHDKNNVFLFNHPKFNQQNTFHNLPWTSQFTGDTCIDYEGYPTAVVNLELHRDYEDLFAILVHESFHCYQYVKGEKRFPNEVLGFMYPLSEENVEIRNQERNNLFMALMANNTSKMNHYINVFVSLREKRADRIDEYLLYENLVETIEGPAWYVELKALAEKSSLSCNLILEKYAQGLIDKYESSLHIRRSCYSSGLFICLLLDKISPDWKYEFFESELSLYDFFKQQYAELSEFNLEDIEISKETQDIVNFIKQNKVNEFETFLQKPGFHLLIEGKIAVKTFDPMNITILGEKVLHKSYVKVRISDSEYFIRQPVMACFSDHFLNLNKLHLILDINPVMKFDSLSIHGIGVIEGEYMKRGNYHHLLIQ
ncbi:hypothetical protein [Neobacillus mesonae]|uniref:Peptide ABC transporter permease n=1 Tax=Neobacillus mesonae TaxID=1193713 RepID=A0A3Q9QXE7_9BACI|nr:hypothetical protein [Neobacillus mesonae]AZU60991.1 hypothetical protein CHR53_06845 [Neobacillus mesonae]